MSLIRDIYTPHTLDDFIINPIKIKIINALMQKKILLIIQTSPYSYGLNTFSNLILKKYYEGKYINSDNVCIINSLKEYGISFYRNELKNFCITKSTIPNKRKTIYIQDMDCLNDQCQQVFRNFIDNYDVNIIITTNSQNKIIESINSRMTTIELDKLQYNDVYPLCKKIIKNENINMNDEQLKDIIINSNYRLSNIYIIFDKILLLNKNIIHNSSMIHYSLFNEFIEKCTNHNINAMFIMINIYHDGYSLIDILDDFFSFLKASSLSENIKYKVIPIISKYMYIFQENSESEIELCFFTNDIIKCLKSF